MQNRFALCAFLALGVVFQAQSTVPLLPQHQDRDHAGEDGGIVRFHGSVYASPCVMAGESRMQDIDMGEMTARSFHRAGDHSQPVLIKIYLRDCLKGASMALSSLASKTTGSDWRAYTTGEQAVQMTFIGESDVADPALLHTAGMVQGAGIRLMDMSGNKLAINQTQTPSLVKYGDSVLTFMAALESTGNTVTAGEFQGLLRVKMEYL